MSEKFWYKVARTIIKAGAFPFPITSTLYEFLQTIITEEQGKFLLIFRKSTMTMEQIKARTDLDDDALDKLVKELMENGVIVNAPSRSTGVMVYRLMGPYPGIFEYSLMRGETSEKTRRLAELCDKLFDELGEKTQKNYDSMVGLFKQAPAIDRTLAVEKELDVGQEVVLPIEDINEYIEEYGKVENNLAVACCYCRHEHELLGNPCKTTEVKKNCFLLDKSAQYAIEHGFAEPIYVEDAKKLMREAGESGLVHKVFHVRSDIKRGIEAICNCCKCCCGILGLYLRGIAPLHTISSYIARIEAQECIGCGTCVGFCPVNAIELVDSIAIVDNDMCIGCGVCTHKCTEETIHLERTGPRDVFIPPQRLEIKD